MDLMESRAKIDEIDKEIADLFEKRMDIAREVALYKMKTGKRVYDKQREDEKLEVLEGYTKNEFNRRGIRELFSQIMAISRKLQYTLVLKQDIVLKSVKWVDQLSSGADTKVVYFGVKGTYTDKAMHTIFGEEVVNYAKPTFHEVMEDVQEGRADYGVLPIENSSTGGINDIYDLIAQYNIYIVGEHVEKIDNVLIGLAGAKIEDIRHVYSHEQPLLQCASYLRQHPQMECHEFGSTAASARKVAQDGDVTQAAIGGSHAAECYGLEVLQEHISSEKSNSTRFIIISKQQQYLRSANKISICFEVIHESGSLYHMLSHFIYNHINMNKIESRPIKDKKWEYRFYVDVDGHLEDPGIQNAIAGIKEEAIGMRILGAYPSFEESYSN